MVACISKKDTNMNLPLSVGCDILQVYGVIWNKGDLCVDRLCDPVSLLDRPGGLHFEKVAHVLAAVMSTIKDLHELLFMADV